MVYHDNDYGTCTCTLAGSMSIVTPSEREGIAGTPGSHGINESTPGVSVVEPKHGPQQPHDSEQQQLSRALSNKSEADSLQLKQVGNDHFRKKDFFKAIQRYTLVRGFTITTTCPEIMC